MYSHGICLNMLLCVCFMESTRGVLFLNFHYSTSSRSWVSILLVICCVGANGSAGHRAQDLDMRLKVACEAYIQEATLRLMGQLVPFLEQVCGRDH